MRCRWLMVLAGALTVVSACGPANSRDAVVSSSGSAGAMGTVSPHQSMPTPADTCPPFNPTSWPSGDVLAARAASIDALREDAEAVTSYAYSQPDFADFRFEHGAAETFLVVGFSDGVARHRAAIAELVTHEDRVLVCRMAHSKKELDVVMAELQAATMAGQFRASSFGPSQGVLQVAFFADQQADAAALVARYADLVEVTVGLHPYPLNGSSEPGAPCAGTDLTPPVDQLGLAVRLELTQTEVASGAAFSGTLTLRNEGAAFSGFNTGATVVATVLNPGTNTVAGVYVGALNDVGATGALQPGDELVLSVIGATATCDASLGYGLPPGGYDVVVAMPRLGDPALVPRVDPPPLISNRVQLTVR